MKKTATISKLARSKPAAENETQIAPAAPKANPKGALFTATAIATLKYFPGTRWLESKGRIIAVSENFEQRTGLAASAVIGHSTANVFAHRAEDKATLRIASERAQKRGHSAPCRFVFINAPAGVAWIGWAIATEPGVLWAAIPAF